MSVRTLKINEIFYSIQGESSYAGCPCVFVRLTFCNLRCTYCDTEYAFYGGEDRTFDEILAAIEAYDCRTVEITGGEPLVQAPVFDFMRMLCDRGYRVLLETGGSLDVSHVDPRVIKIMDLKCPSSGMSHRNFLSNIDILSPQDEVKFVIGTKEDYQWAVKTARALRLHERIGAVLLSPVFGQLEPVKLVEWVLEDRLQASLPNLRFQLQLHKFIWSPETRGV